MHSAFVPLSQYGDAFPVPAYHGRFLEAAVLRCLASIVIVPAVDVIANVARPLTSRTKIEIRLTSVGRPNYSPFECRPAAIRPGWKAPAAWKQIAGRDLDGTRRRFKGR
jgi:hypothetical protein